MIRKHASVIPGEQWYLIHPVPSLVRSSVFNLGALVLPDLLSLQVAKVLMQSIYK